VRVESEEGSLGSPNFFVSRVSVGFFGIPLLQSCPVQKGKEVNDFQRNLPDR